MLQVKRYLVAAAFLMLCVFSIVVADAAGVKARTVEVEGVGDDRRTAIEAGLVEAISQVTGISITNQQLSTVSTSNSTVSLGTSSISLSSMSETSSDEMSSSLSGSVRSYQVVEVFNGRDGRVHAKLSVDVNHYEADASNQRRRIAVVPFRLPDGAGQEIEQFRKYVNQGAVDYVTGTRHFSVVDRNFENERFKEFLRLLLPDVGQSERARIGNTSGTDYLVVGEILEFETVKTSQYVEYTKETLTKVQKKVAIVWRVIEAATGQVLVSGTINRSLNATRPEIGLKLGSEIGETINNIIYPIVALDYSNGRISLSQGGTSMRVGRVYTLNRYGKVQYDPYTKEAMAREEIPVGTVRIVSVSPKISYAQILSCSVDLDGMAPKEYVLRAQPSDSETSASGTVGVQVQPTMVPAW